MAEATEISWTDSTFNPWTGCSKVSPGCDHCYAEVLDKRHLRSRDLHWGPNTKPALASDATWKKPIAWQKKAAATNNVRKVFCGSMCDFADSRAPAGARTKLWEVVRQTPNLRWQMLTKRPKNIVKSLPGDWGDGYVNVSLGVTVEDINHGVPRIDILRSIPCALRFLSIEPLIEDIGKINLSGIGWVIVGGESGRGARPMKIDWVYSIREQCRQQNVPFFYKQRGAVTGHGDCLLDGVEVKEWPTFFTYDQGMMNPDIAPVIVSNKDAACSIDLNNVTSASFAPEFVVQRQAKIVGKRPRKSTAERQRAYKRAHNIVPLGLPSEILDIAGEMKEGWGLSSKARAVEIALLMAKDSTAMPQTSKISISIPICELAKEATTVAQAKHDCIIVSSSINTLEEAHGYARHIMAEFLLKFPYPMNDYALMRQGVYGCELELGYNRQLNAASLIGDIIEIISKYLRLTSNTIASSGEIIIFKMIEGRKSADTLPL